MAAQEDLFNLQIEVGRLEVLQERAWQALKTIRDVNETPTEKPVVHGDENPVFNVDAADVPAERNDLFNLAKQLRDAQVRTVEFRSVVCAAKDAAFDGCIHEPRVSWPDVNHVNELDVQAVRKTYENTLEDLMPLWGDVCAQAVAQTGDDLFCSVE